MTIRTHHLALCDLREDLLKRVCVGGLHRLGDLEALRSGDVVEVHHARRKAPTTIRAGMVFRPRDDRSDPRAMVRTRPTRLCTLSLFLFWSSGFPTGFHSTAYLADPSMPGSHARNRMTAGVSVPEVASTFAESRARQGSHLGSIRASACTAGTEGTRVATPSRRHSAGKGRWNCRSSPSMQATNRSGRQTSCEPPARFARWPAQPSSKPAS